MPFKAVYQPVRGAFFWLGVSTALLTALGPGCPARAQETAETSPASVTFESHLMPFFSKYCVECHGEKKKKADVNLEIYGAATRMVENRKLWETVRDMVLEREMPPEDKPQPSQEEREMLTHFIEEELAKLDCSGPVNPGRVTLRRLNRQEYDNTIRDLVGLDFHPSSDFPSDEVGYGFDNIGDVLSLPPILMEKYLNAAEDIASRALLTEYPPAAPSRTIAGDRFRPDTKEDFIRQLPGEALGLYREGTGSTRHEFPVPGRYLFRIRAYGEQAGPEPPRLSLLLDDRQVKTFGVKATRSKPGIYDWTMDIPAPGRQKISVGYMNNYNVQNHPDPEMRGDRNLFVNWLEVVGPLDQAPPPLPESHRLIMVCDPLHQHTKACAETSLRQFAGRAWRRPATDEEVQRLVRFVDLAQEQKDGFLEGIQLAVQAVLTSPKFLFRWELDPEPASPEGVRPLTDYELASRLSYFLWSSLPDEHLFGLARSGTLRREGVLQSEIQRMLQDAKAQALVDNFAGQWLQIRNLAGVTPDPELFPEFDEDLRHAMEQETKLFFSTILREDRSVLEFIDADFTFLNGKLAAFYGIPEIRGEEFQRVQLKPADHRGGVLTHASILTITSNPTRTSPVLRGKWILEQILGTPPPPPPPNVPLLEEDGQTLDSASLRERLELHRTKPDCAACHNKMDPMGFAFENYNAIGKWRTMDGSFPINPSGALPEGETFQGPEELKKLLMTRDAFVISLSEKMLTFALGRGLEYYDKCAVDEIHTALAKNNFRFSALVTGIATSEPFMKKSIGSGPQTASINP